MKLSEIAKAINGHLIGEDMEVVTIRSLEVAQRQDLTILLDKKHLEKAKNSKAGAIVAAEEGIIAGAMIKVDNPRAVFAKTVELFDKKDTRAGVSKFADIDNATTIGENVFIDSFVKVDAGVVIGDGVRLYSGVSVGKDSVIGKGTVLFSNVSIYHNIEIGENCIFHSGVVVGADGFGFERNKDNEWDKVPQLGKVIIGNNVEIGANTCVDRGCLLDTVICDGVKLDNLVQIGHNSYIGKHSLLSAVCAIAGSTTIGEYNMFAGDVGTVGHLKTGSNVIAMARTGITKDVPDGEMIRGFPARPHKEVVREEMTLRRMVKKKISERGKDKKGE